METYLPKGRYKYDGSLCGASGMLVVPQIAELLKNIILVRKQMMADFG